MNKCKCKLCECSITTYNHNHSVATGVVMLHFKSEDDISKTMNCIYIL